MEEHWRIMPFVFKHDTTIEVLFSSFGFNETNYRDHAEPGYAACVSFELWRRSQNEHYIKVCFLCLLVNIYL